MDLACGKTALITIAGSNATPAQKACADGVCTGSGTQYTDDLLIQNLIDGAVSSGAESITVKAFGTFWIGSPIRIPYAVNFSLDGEGIPNVLFNIADAQVTPTAGTQFRSTPAWNTTPWYGSCSTSGKKVTKTAGNFSFDANWVSQPFYVNNVSYYVASVDASDTLTLTESAGTQTNVAFWYSPSIFVRVKPNPTGGVINALGQTRFENCALMPAWGTVSNSVAVYGLTDVYGSNLRLDNFMFLPYGWLEEGQPAVDYADNPFMALNCQGGNYGGGSDCTIGSVYIFAHGGSGPIWESVIGYDCVSVRKLMMFSCFRGILFQDAWFNEIDELIVYGATGFAAAFNTDQGRGNVIHRLNYESMGIGRMSGNPLVYLYDNVYVQVDSFYNWPSNYSADITAITNDDSRIEKTCLAFNLGNSGIIQAIPFTVPIKKPFGGKIAAPFSNGNYPTAGYGSGNLALPTSGVTYRVGDPLDITVSGGQGVKITTKDAQGNVIDNAVSSLAHRLLKGSMRYTNTYLKTGDYLTVTYTAAPAVTVVLAAIGPSGSSAAPSPDVNYLADRCGLDLSFSGGSGVSARVSDGSTSAGGSALDAGMTSAVAYHMAPGQVINFGNFTQSPTALSVRRHSEI